MSKSWWRYLANQKCINDQCKAARDFYKAVSASRAKLADTAPRKTFENK